MSSVEACDLRHTRGKKPLKEQRGPHQAPAEWGPTDAGIGAPIRFLKEGTVLSIAPDQCPGSRAQLFWSEPSPHWEVERSKVPGSWDQGVCGDLHS